jgi:outer membrane protein OmpA-like peptidoglycan-associated protein
MEEKPMKRAIVVAACCLLLAGVAAAQGEQQPARMMLDWGMTNPQTTFTWDFGSTPTGVQGQPQEFLVEFNFPLNSARLTPEAKGALTDYVVRKAHDLQGDHSGMRLLVLGFANSAKERGHARSLGLRRAEAVRDYLVRLGVSRRHIEVASFGDQYSATARYETDQRGFDRRSETWIMEGAHPLAAR